MSDFNVENIKIEGDLKFPTGLTTNAPQVGDVLSLGDGGVVEFVPAGFGGQIRIGNNIPMTSGGGNTVRTVTFSSPMPSTSYAVSVQVITSSNFNAFAINQINKTVNGFTFQAEGLSGVSYDYIAIHL